MSLPSMIADTALSVGQIDSDVDRTDHSVRSRGIGACQLASWFQLKGVVDRILAILFLIPGLPIIGFLIVLVRLSSRGPGIYRQVRVGKDGREYMMYKVRTMRQDAEVGTGPVWTSQNDPRITKLGHILRKLHLDEFPQLFNVLRGEMSLIGPRPERPEFVKMLAVAIPGYRDRLLVLPGITGLAQINLPPDTDLDSVRRKLILDLQYVEEASLGMDVRMFACTFLRLVGVKGDLAMRIMRLKRTVHLPAAGPELDLPFGPQVSTAAQAKLAGSKQACEAGSSANGHSEAASPHTHKLAQTTITSSHPR